MLRHYALRVALFFYWLAVLLALLPAGYHEEFDGTSGGPCPPAVLEVFDADPSEHCTSSARDRAGFVALLLVFATTAAVVRVTPKLEPLPPPADPPDPWPARRH